ncbi:mitotic checkpoint protein PRCC-carboxy-term protein [Wolffia australiana]
MESLVATYGSSDEEEATGNGRGEERRSFPPPRPPKSFSLPPPKISSSSLIFSSLPPAKSSSSSTSSFFSSLPAPKSLPRKPLAPKSTENEEDGDENEAKRRKKTLDFSSKPLSSIIPAPKNTLCLAPSSSGSMRRSVLEKVPPPSESYGEAQASYGGQWAEPYAVQSDSAGVAVDVAWPSTAESYDLAGSHGGFECKDWGYAASSAAEVVGSIAELGRRGKNAIPSEIIEVKQEELVKNRPREDQVRLTGIAFGPAYQPVASGGKAKPSKLHRRKHQIGSLYFDMKQKETELAERRSRGLLTKKETQAKYGW